LSADLDRRSNGAGRGPARGYRWADAEPGNLLAATHGFHIDPTLRTEHRAELDEIGAVVWDLLPVERPEFRLALAVEPPIAPGKARKRRGLFVAQGNIDQIGEGSPVAPGSFAAGAASIPVPGEIALADRLAQLGVPLADPIADCYHAGVLGRLVRHSGAPHPFLVQGGEMPSGARVTRAVPVAQLLQKGGFTWNGPTDDG
jgi:hypothetical protein